MLIRQELGFWQTGEICNDSNTNNRVLGYENKFQSNEHLSPRWKNSKHQIEISGTLPEPSCNQFVIDKNPGSFNLHSSSSIYSMES